MAADRARTPTGAIRAGYRRAEETPVGEFVGQRQVCLPLGTYLTDDRGGAPATSLARTAKIRAMTIRDHDKYQFKLPAGWATQAVTTEDVPVHMLFVNPDDQQAELEGLPAVGNISDFTYFVQEGKRKIDMYDLVETFETWAHQRKFKFDEPVENSKPRDTIEFEVIGNATGADGRRHFVWLVGDEKTVVRVHFVLKDLDAGARKLMADLIEMVSSIRIS